MEVDWVQRQLAGYVQDSHRILCRLQCGDENGLLADRALNLLRTYLDIPANVSRQRCVDEQIIKLAQILFIYIQAHGFWEDICQLWPKLQRVAKTLPESCNYFEISKQLALVKNDRGEAQAAEILYEELIHAAEFCQLPAEQQADILHQAGVCYYRQGNYSRAQHLLVQCLAIHNPTDRLSEISKTHNPSEPEYLLRVHTAIPPLWESKAYAFNQLGNIALAQGDFKRAQRCYNESLQIFVDHGEINNLACVTYQSLGGLFAIQRRFAESIPLLEKSVAIRRQRGEKGGSAYAAIYLAASYLGQQRLTEAEELLSSSISICRDLQNGRNIALCHLYFGYLEQKRGNYLAALAQWRQAQLWTNTIAMPALELQVLAAFLSGLLHTGHLWELKTTLLHLRANVRKQNLGLRIAVRLLMRYLCW